jgi:RNA polymerase sigma factor (sigma-70 family)
MEGAAEAQAVGLEGGSIATSEFDDLFRRRRVAMIRLARVLTGSMAVAEDLVQDAFMKLHEQDVRPQNPEGYLHTIVVNMSRNYMRRRQLEQRLSAKDRVSFEDPAIDELWSMVCQLPFRQRAVLALRFYEDLPEADIARVLDCRLGTVKSTLHRALAKLQKELS